MLTNQLGVGAADLAELVPELGQFAPDLPRPLSADAESMRFRLFDAVATLLREEARSKPIVLVLEDVHAADESSLLLLRFVARTVTDARLLVIATTRSSDRSATEPFAGTLAGWREPNGSATFASAASLGRRSPTLSQQREMSPPPRHWSTGSTRGRTATLSSSAK
jgi:predicted ATPase